MTAHTPNKTPTIAIAVTVSLVANAAIVAVNAAATTATTIAGHKHAQKLWKKLHGMHAHIVSTYSSGTTSK